MVRLIYGAFLVLAAAALAEEPGLVGAWRFDEGRGPVVRDSSGRGLDGKIINPEHVEHVEGKRGGALEFGGSERGKFGCVQVPGMHQLDFSQGFTIESWIRFNDRHVRPDTCYIASDGAWKGPGWRFLIPYNVLFLQSGDGENMWGAGSDAATHGPLENNRWYHVAGTFNGSVYRVYLDGVMVASVASDHAITRGSDTLSIGSYAGGTDSVFRGTIDELRLYDHGKTPLEILQAARLNVWLE